MIVLILFAGPMCEYGTHVRDNKPLALEPLSHEFFFTVVLHCREEIVWLLNDENVFVMVNRSVSRADEGREDTHI